ASSKAYAAGDPQKGAQVYRACAACHSLEPGRHLTGPSLAHVYGRKAGTAEGFVRYSKALKESKIVWDDKALDAWLKKPEALVPGNLMPFPGIPDAQVRADLIAFLKNAGSSAAGAPPASGMMGGMMQAPDLPNLKQAPPENQVKAVRYCRDSYFITFATGEVVPYWEFNLRLKTDSSAQGPAKDKPVLVDNGMRGDRAALVFSNPLEISRFIRQQCE
ncbi:MAG: c-type cytochrome, partial [Sulfurifustis sp.]